jgi:predicted transcriptional regulator
MIGRTQSLSNPDANYLVTAHANSHQVTRQTARTDLNELVARGLLVTAKAGKSVVYQPYPDLEERLRRSSKGRG